MGIWAQVRSKIGSHSRPAAVDVATAAPPCTQAPDANLYPPADRRLTVVRAATLLQHHAPEIQQIQQATGLATHQMDAMVAAPIRRMAALVCNLPATRDDYYRGAGGLFRLSIDTALYSARVAQQTEFGGLGMIERRRREAPRWRLATALAALCIDMHRTVTSFVVIDPQKAQWSPLLTPLDDWVTERQIDHVELTWRGTGEPARDRRAWNLSLKQHVITPDIEHYLHEGDPDILAQFLAYMSDDPTAAQGNMIKTVVEGIRAKLIARDLAVDPMRFGKKALGTTLGPHVADGLRTLLTTGKWTFNEDKGRIWIAPDACYLVWPIAAKEIMAWLAGQNLAGAPTDPHTLAELLRDAGIIKPFQGGSDASCLLWPITLPSGRSVSALRLSSSDVLFPSGEVPPAANVRLNEPSAAMQKQKPSHHADAATTAPPAGAKPTAIAPDTKPSTESNLEQRRANAKEALDRAIAQLPKPAQVLIKDLIERMKQPEQSSGVFHVRSDGKLEVSPDFFGTVGFDKSILIDQLASGGWLEVSGGKFITQAQSSQLKSACILTTHMSRLMLPASVHEGLFVGSGDG